MVTAPSDQQTVRIARELLQRMPVLGLLSAEQLDRVMAASRLVRYQKRATLALKGAQVDHLAFLVEGKIQVVNYLPDGREFGLNIIQAGNFFGELAVIDRQPRSATLIALTPSAVIQVPGDVARKLFFEIPAVAEAMMQYLARTLRRMSDLRALQAMPGAFQRVYALLNYLKEVTPAGLHQINDVPTHQEIAIMVNTSRETVTRAIARLLDEGVVQKDLRRLLIRKPEVLTQLVEAGPPERVKAG
jgi:CRP/FNR family cyclic AMP-dependent transcriptional regulator